MKKNRKITEMTLTAAFFFMLCSPASAAFLDTDFNIRSKSMGGAQAAAASGAAGVFSNPASNAQISSPEGYFMYSRPFAGLEFKAGADSVVIDCQSAAVACSLGKAGVISPAVTIMNSRGLYAETAYILNYAIPYALIDEVIRSLERRI